MFVDIIFNKILRFASQKLYFYLKKLHFAAKVPIQITFLSKNYFFYKCIIYIRNIIIQPKKYIVTFSYKKYFFDIIPVQYNNLYGTAALQRNCLCYLNIISTSGTFQNTTKIDI
jgi:hypothetical protein